MPYDESAVVASPPERRGDSLLLAWSAPVGSTVQVYLDARLAWSGVADSCCLPWPPTRVRIDIGTVDPGEGSTDFSASLPGSPAERATLSWQGGNYLAADGLARFDIFASASPGGPVSMAARVGTVAAYDAGVETDGYGQGGFGSGGFGSSASAYSWTSAPLASGVWSFAVVAVDQVGNDSPAATASITITGPPAPPPRDPAGNRLEYAIDPTGVPTLTWLPSPG